MLTPNKIKELIKTISTKHTEPRYGLYPPQKKIMDYISRQISRIANDPQDDINKIQEMTNLLEGLDDFEVTLQASVQPVQITLQFYSPWGFRGAMLLKQFDKLIRMALTARHIGP